MMEVVETTGAIRHAKLQSNRHQQQTNTQLLQAGCPSCHPIKSVGALKGECITFLRLAHSKHIWGILSLSLPLNDPGYLGEDCQVSHQSYDASIRKVIWLNN